MHVKDVLVNNTGENCQRLVEILGINKFYTYAEVDQTPLYQTCKYFKRKIKIRTFQKCRK